MAGPEKSIWKKEISLKRKPKSETEAPQPPAEGQPKTSIWKKEIGLGRKPREQAAPAPVPAPEPEPEREPAAAPRADPEQPKTSIWKREIGRPKPRKQAAAPAAEPEPASAPASTPPHRPESVAALLRPIAETPAPSLPPVSAPSPHVPVSPPAAAPEAEPEPEPEPAPVAAPPVAPAPAELPADPFGLAAAGELLAREPVRYEPAGHTESVAEPEAEPEPEPEPEPEQPAPAELPPAFLEDAIPLEPAHAFLPEAPTDVLLPDAPLDLDELPVALEGAAVEAVAAEPEGLPSRRERREGERARRRETKQAAKQAAAEAKRVEQAAREREKAQKRQAPHRQKKVVGLKIGSTHLAAAQVANNGAPRLLQVADEPLEPGIVVSGELREPDELAASLKAFFRKHRLPRSGVRLGVASNRIGVRIFELEGIEDPRQLDNAIRFRAQETLPIPLDEAVLDYRILSEKVDESGAITRRVLLVVAHRDLVERYVAACRKAGIKLAGVDLEPFALLRALAPAEEGRLEDAGIVVVSIGRDRSTLAVSDGEICEYTRVLDWGGGSLDAALARALEISPPEAEPIKRSLSLRDTDPPPEGMSVEEATAMRVALRSELQTFTRDLLASLRYYQERPGSLGIAEIVLTGGGACLAGLPEELSRALGVQVRVGDPMARVVPSRKVKKAAPDSRLTAAIGLGIEV
jgi:type IV pilus assembly protein PilM